LPSDRRFRSCPRHPHLTRPLRPEGRRGEEQSMGFLTGDSARRPVPRRPDARGRGGSASGCR
jgi:hypothetical protein